jgi:ribosomal protein S5
VRLQLATIGDGGLGDTLRGANLVRAEVAALQHQKRNDRMAHRRMSTMGTREVPTNFDSAVF